MLCAPSALCARAQVWSGFSREAFKNLGHYLSYGIPSTIMICCELCVCARAEGWRQG